MSSNSSIFNNAAKNAAKNKYKNLHAKYRAGLGAMIFGSANAKAKFSENIAKPLNQARQLLLNMGINPDNVSPSTGTGMR
jgi:hypothetical protein